MYVYAYWIRNSGCKTRECACIFSCWDGTLLSGPMVHTLFRQQTERGGVAWWWCILLCHSRAATAQNPHCTYWHVLSSPNHESKIASDFKPQSPNRKNIPQIAVKNASNRNSSDLKPFSSRSRIAAPSPSNHICTKSCDWEHLGHVFLNMPGQTVWNWFMCCACLTEEDICKILTSNPPDFKTHDSF